MRPDPVDEASRHGGAHQRGTILSDGTVSSGTLDIAVAGSSGDLNDAVAGFDGTYPFAAFNPMLDVVAPPPPVLDAAPAMQNATASISGSEAVTGAVSVLSGLTIVPDYDSSITGLLTTSPALYSEITGAITAAIGSLEAGITSPMVITIDFSYGELQGVPLGGDDLGSSFADYYNNSSYTAIVNALSSHATSAAALESVSTLPSSSPVAGATWDLTFAEMKALGLPAPIGLPALTPSSTEVDGWVAISDTLPLDYSPTDRAVNGEYDSIGVLEHEITEDMGRVQSLGTYVSIADVGGYTPFDLFRYTSPGVPDLTPGPGYFSTDGGLGGATNKNTFNDPTHGGDAGDWASNVADDLFDSTATEGVANIVSATDLRVMNVLGYAVAAACYAAGTRILRSDGEVRVEDLAVGDIVRTRFGGLVPIKWIGHRRIDCRRHPAQEQVWPVRVVAGAFGAGQPTRDLLLSPDHAVAVGDALIPIKLLVNGASIRREPGWRRIHYFHIELDRHDIVFADGLPAESYLDTGNRGMFSNATVPLELHPRLDDVAAQARRATRSCLPVCCDPAQVRPVWHALAERSHELGLPLPAVATTTDPELRLVVGTRRVAPIARDGDCYTFVVPAHRGGVRLVSRHAIPAASRPWLGDTRRLGVAIRRISLRCGMSHVDVALDDPRLTDGWWDVERDAATMWRWTDGDAALPCATGATTIEVLIGDTLPYGLDDPMPVRQDDRRVPGRRVHGRRVQGHG